MRVLGSIILSMASLYAGDAGVKHMMKSNSQVVYHQTPGEVSSFTEMMAQGSFYGRLRSNTFSFTWNTEDAKHDSHLISALGGSIVYKSAQYDGFDFTTGLYYARAFFNEDADPVARLKPGTDIVSRFDFSNTGNKSMGVLGEAYLRYQGWEATELKVGRQMVESFYTKSNNTKMIPNTFDSVVVSSKVLEKTRFQLGYLHRQKLRAHTQAHSVLMYGDANATSAINPQWSHNDDSAMHRGLTYTALKAAGIPTDSPLIVGDIRNQSIENLKIESSFYIVPEMVSQLMGELNYTFTLSDGMKVSPGFRYIKQFDHGAGEAGGASYMNNTTGYDDPNSLDGGMVAARVVAKIDNYKFNLGYTKVFDEGDLVTPWRGFPTAGYTRSMARYNWRANTASYRIEMQRNANNTGIYKDMYIQASVLYTDGDSEKAGSHVVDEIYYYAGFMQNLSGLMNLQWRLRLGYAQYTESDTYNNLDARFELNYFF